MASNSKAAAASGTTATKTGVPKATTRRGRPPREGLSHWQQRVLDLVRASTEPSSAYDILREMKDDGITAPPVVYRALKGLLDRGLVHRIESSTPMSCAAGRTIPIIIPRNSPSAANAAGSRRSPTPRSTS